MNCFESYIFFLAVDHCYGGPCLNNGSCVNSLDGYQCDCLEGFQGPNCEGITLCNIER